MLTLGALDLAARPYISRLQGSSFGQWVPLQSVIASLYVDGSVVTGDMTGNREIVLKVLVDADSPDLLAQACEALISEANAPSNLLTWTPDAGGVPRVYETFRASSLARADEDKYGPLRRVYDLHLPARPFVRSAVREQASAAPPGVSVDGMEASAAGVVMSQQVPGLSISGWGTVATAAPCVDAAVSPVARFTLGSVLAAVTVTGGSAAAATGSPSSVPMTRVTASAAGTVLVKTAAAFATSADYVTVDWAAVLSTFTSVPRSYQAGVEWLDASNAVVRTDWGVVASFNTSSVATPRAVWQASARPSTATQARALLRLTATATSETFDIYAVTIQPSTGGTVTPTNMPHDGTAALGVTEANLTRNEDGSGTTYFYVYRAGMYARRALPAALDLSAQTRLRAWLQVGGGSLNDSDPAIRLWDSAGNWSRYTVASVGMFPTGTWVLAGADLASPTETSTTPCNLAAVVAYDLMASTLTTADYNVTGVSMAVYLDTVTAGPADAANLTPRGTVLSLDGIKGSARSTAAVVLTNSVAMTDWLVASIDGTTGDPLLVVTSNAATGTGYDGVYSILCGRTDTSALTSPTLTVTQKIAGTTVATRTLTGAVNGKYVDYGAVELPLVDTPDENTGVTYAFALSPTSTSYADLLVVDVDASMVWLPTLSTARKVGMVDEPDPLAGVGKVWVGDLADRSDARAPVTAPILSRPMHVQAPGVRTLAYSTSGAPSVTEYYWPRFVAEPTS